MCLFVVLNLMECCFQNISLEVGWVDEKGMNVPGAHELSQVWLLRLWIVAHQAPMSMRLSRHEYWRVGCFLHRDYVPFVIYNNDYLSRAFGEDKLFIYLAYPIAFIITSIFCQSYTVWGDWRERDSLFSQSCLYPHFLGPCSAQNRCSKISW